MRIADIENIFAANTTLNDADGFDYTVSDLKTPLKTGAETSLVRGDHSRKKFDRYHALRVLLAIHLKRRTLPSR